MDDVLDSVLSKQNFTQGTNSHFHVPLSCANLSSAGVRTEGMMEELQPRLPPLRSPKLNHRPHFTLKDTRELTKVTHLASFQMKQSFELLALPRSEAGVAVLGSPGPSQPA